MQFASGEGFLQKRSSTNEPPVQRILTHEFTRLHCRVPVTAGGQSPLSKDQGRSHPLGREWRRTSCLQRQGSPRPSPSLVGPCSAGHCQASACLICYDQTQAPGPLLCSPSRQVGGWGEGHVVSNSLALNPEESKQDCSGMCSIQERLLVCPGKLASRGL